MVRAALSKGLCPRQLSCKGALQAVNGLTPALVLAEGAVVVTLLDAALEIGLSLVNVRLRNWFLSIRLDNEDSVVCTA